MNNTKKHEFTTAQKDFLIRASDKYTRIERLKVFNKRFRLNLTESQLNNFCNKNSIYLKRGTKFTEEQDEWLEENINLMGFQDLTEEFNRKFGTNKTYYSINNHCHRFCINQTESDRLLFDNRKIRSGNHRPIGYERTLSNGRTYVKYRESEYEDRFIEGSTFGKTYMEKKRYMYLMYHPEEKFVDDECIIQLDGDKTNFGEDNLVKVPNIVSRNFALMLMEHPDNTVEMNRTWIEIFRLDNEIRQEDKKENA